MNKIDKLIRAMTAKSDWVLIVSEDTGDETAGGILLPNAMKTPFSRVLKVGPGVQKEICEVGDRVMFREGMAVNNEKEKQRYTKDNYLWVHKTNILGVAPKDESLQAGANGSEVEASP